VSSQQLRGLGAERGQRGGEFGEFGAGRRGERQRKLAGQAESEELALGRGLSGGVGAGPAERVAGDRVQQRGGLRARLKIIGVGPAVRVVGSAARPPAAISSTAAWAAGPAAVVGTDGSGAGDVLAADSDWCALPAGDTPTGRGGRGPVGCPPVGGDPPDAIPANHVRYPAEVSATNG
jgi:hypothetical protein